MLTFLIYSSPVNSSLILMVPSSKDAKQSQVKPISPRTRAHSYYAMRRHPTIGSPVVHGYIFAGIEPLRHERSWQIARITRPRH